MTTSDVLNRAADLIEERGWGRGPTTMLGVGGTCVMGAIYVASHGAHPDDECDAYAAATTCPVTHAVFEYLRAEDLYMDRPNDLWHWNDNVAQQQSQVVEVLRACAVIEASRERETAEASA